MFFVVVAGVVGDGLLAELGELGAAVDHHGSLDFLVFLDAFGEAVVLEAGAQVDELLAELLVLFFNVPQPVFAVGVLPLLYRLRRTALALLRHPQQLLQQPLILLLDLLALLLYLLLE